MRLARIFIAAVIGGIVVFMWGYVSHEVLPIGKSAIKSLPAEATIMPAIKGAITQPGFYFFPPVNMDNPTKAEQDEWAAKYKAGPRGAVIFDPTGGEPMGMKQLGTELVSNIMAAVIAAVVLTQLGGGLMSRAVQGLLLGAALGAFAWMSIDVSYWNWHRFPTEFALGSLVDQVIGWALAGLVMGMMVGKGAWRSVQLRD